MSRDISRAPFPLIQEANVLAKSSSRGESLVKVRFCGQADFAQVPRIAQFDCLQRSG
jgi:hypothetical protein